MRKNVGKTATMAMLCALATVILIAGSYFGKIDIAVSVAASFCVALALLKFGYKSALSVYAAATVLSFVFCPAKTVAVLFGAFFGYYPVLKMYCETRFSRITAYVVKYLSLNAALAILIAIALYFTKIHILIVVLLFAASNILLPLYDVVYGMAVTACCNKLFNRK